MAVGVLYSYLPALLALSNVWSPEPRSQGSVLACVLRRRTGHDGSGEKAPIGRTTGTHAGSSRDAPTSAILADHCLKDSVS